jgi:hypothetical protein
MKQNKLNYLDITITHLHGQHLYPPDDGRMTEKCCANNIWGGEEELLRCWTTVA